MITFLSELKIFLLTPIQIFFLANAGVAGGFADEYGINGVFNYVSLNETTRSFVGNGSVLNIGVTPVDLNNNGILDPDETESLVVNAVSRNRILNVSGGIVKSTV